MYLQKSEQFFNIYFSDKAAVRSDAAAELDRLTRGAQKKPTGGSGSNSIDNSLNNSECWQRPLAAVLSINHHSKARKLSIIIINKLWIEDFAAANNFSRELTAGFCIYQQQQQQENNNNNLEPATPSMLGVA